MVLNITKRGEMNLNILKKERTEWIDLARGLAIILVVLAHTPIPTKLSSYIYSFHVPLFFIISGFLLRSGLSKKPADFIKNKIIRLAIPYLFFSLIGYIYWVIARQVGWEAGAKSIDIMTPLNGTFMAIRNSSFMAHNSALWFICSLFVSEIIFYMLFRFVKGDKFLLTASVFALMVVGVIYNTFDGAALPWAIDTAPIVLVFLCFGYFVHEYYQSWKKARARHKFARWGALASTIVISCVSWLLMTKTPAGHVDMYYGMYVNFVLYFIAAISGSLMVMLVFESFIPKFKQLAYVGSNSLIIYALHQKVAFGLIAAFFAATIGRTHIFLGQTSIEKLGNGLSYAIIALAMLLLISPFLIRYCGPFVGRGVKRKIPDSI